VVIFGSNGNGGLYAVALTDGRVFRLQDASYLGGVYDGTNYGITVVGVDLRDFLERFLAAVNVSPPTATSLISERSGDPSRMGHAPGVRSITFPLISQRSLPTVTVIDRLVGARQ
jgi:hypothetical protein